jgi:hypothetical protein
MIDTVAVADERVGDAAEFQKAIPVRIVPGQAGNFQPENDAHVSQCHCAGETSEPRALVGAGAGQSQIFVDDHHLLLGPAELASPIGQGILAGRGFAVVFDLARRGLANVNVSGTLGVGGFDFGRISH